MLRIDIPSDETPELTTLKCGACQELKAATMFHRRANSKTGHQYRCKACHVRLKRERYYSAEKERFRYQTDAEYRKKRRARARVNMARTRRGRKDETCVGCGGPKAEAHHIDYDRPKVIVWLCLSCHRKEHLEGHLETHDH